MAKSRSIGGIYASLTLRDGGFRKGLKAARKELNEFGGKALKGLAVGSLATGAALGYGVKQTMALAGALDDSSVNTGIQIKDMMQLRKEFELGGLSAENAGKDIGKMQKSIYAAASGGKDPFASLGLSAANLLAMDPAAQFREVGSAILRIQNPTERTAKAMEIFGKSGAGLVNVFGQAEDASKFLGKMPEVMQQYAGAMARADDLINELPGKGQQFLTGFTAGIIGEVVPALEMTANYDFTPMGQNIGQAIATGMRGILDGTLWEVASLKAFASLSKVFGQVQNLAVESLSGALSNTSLPLMAWKKIRGEEIFTTQADSLMKAMQRDNPYADISKFYEESADILWNNLTRINRNQQEQAAALSVRELPKGPPIVDLAKAEREKRLETPKQALAAPERMEVNAYQRRGLSLDAAATPKVAEEKNQTRLLTDIRDALTRMAENNQPFTWP